MTSTNFPRFVLMLTLLLVNNALQSQSSKEAVILYNSVPVLAEISSDGDVKKIIKEEPDYLEGYVLKVQDYGQFLAIQENLRTDEKEILPASVNLFGHDDNYISVPFERGFATLSDLAISKLDDVIAELSKHPSARVIIRTLSTNNEALLDKNRINSVRTYFKIRGIAQERLSYETLTGDRDINEVKISFLY